jgi:hypothetical protein
LPLQTKLLVEPPVLVTRGAAEATGAATGASFGLGSRGGSPIDAS